MNTYLSSFLTELSDNKSKISIVDEGVLYGRIAISNIIHIYIEHIQTLKLKEGSRVVLLGDRNVESVCFFNALLVLNLIPVLVDKTQPIEQLKELTKDEALTFCFDESLSTLLTANLIPKVDKSNVNSGEGFVFKNAIKKSDDVIFVTHTSGTTGLPKKVAYTEANIYWAVSEYKKIYKLDIYDKVLFALPFHYCFGFIACCLSPLNAGKTVVILKDGTEVSSAAKLIENEKVQILVINPYFYNELCKLNLSNFDFSSLKICDSGGDVLPIPVIEKFRDQTNVVITEGYGLTETSSLTHFLFPEDNGNIKIGSVGIPCSDVECIIVNAAKDKLNAGEIGELLVKGPMVIKSYDNDIYNNDAFYDEWFRTGDLFYFDDEGYYYLVGRKKDVGDIPQDLLLIASKIIPKLFDVKNVSDLAYRFADNKDLQIYIVPLETDLKARDLLIKSVLSNIPKQILDIAHIKLVSYLPRTATGKVIKRKL